VWGSSGVEISGEVLESGADSGWIENVFDFDRGVE
jgi:hypothetical protein